MMRFFQADSTAPAAMLAHVGADCLKKPHHIVTLRFIEVVKDHANYLHHVQSIVMYHGSN